MSKKNPQSSKAPTNSKRDRILAMICNRLKQTAAVVHPGGKTVHIARAAYSNEVVSFTPTQLADVIAAALELK